MDKKKIILFSSIIVLSLCVAFILVSILSNNNKTDSLSPVQYLLDTEPMLPKKPGYDDEYIYSQIPSKSWTQEQIDGWFTRPEGENLDQLKLSNDQVVRRILEAAP